MPPPVNDPGGRIEGQDRVFATGEREEIPLSSLATDEIWTLSRSSGSIARSPSISTNNYSASASMCCSGATPHWKLSSSTVGAERTYLGRDHRPLGPIRCGD